MYLKSKKLYIRITAIVILIYMVISMCVPILCVAEQPMEHQIKRKPPVIVEKSITREADVRLVSFSEVTTITPTEPPIEPTVTPTLTPEPISKFSEEDINLVARVTMSEASTQSFDAQVAVAQTVINRLYDGGFGSTINKIVYTPYQFSTSDNGDPTEQVYNAVKEAINNKPYPEDMLYFRENHYHNWGTDYKKIGVFYFSLG